MKIKLKKQESDDGCGIACVAMVADMTVKHAVETIKMTTLSEQEMDKSLTELDISFVKYDYPNLYAKATYIAITPSLNEAGMNHWIVIQTDSENKLTVFDPSTKNTYTSESLFSWTNVIEIIT